METIQNYNITPARADHPPVDRGEIVTLSRTEIELMINHSVNQAAAKFEKMFVQAMAHNTAAIDVVLGRKWMGTREAAVALGKKPSQLLTMVKDGRLRVGIEVRDDSKVGIGDRENISNPVYVFNISQCEVRLLTLHQERENNEEIR